MKLVIESDGSVHSVYNDALPLLGLGPISTERASHVEFNETRQLWEARRATDGALLAEGTNRKEVVMKEVEVLEKDL